MFSVHCYTKKRTELIIWQTHIFLNSFRIFIGRVLYQTYYIISLFLSPTICFSVNFFFMKMACFAHIFCLLVKKKGAKKLNIQCKFFWRLRNNSPKLLLLFLAIFFGLPSRVCNKEDRLKRKVGGTGSTWIGLDWNIYLTELQSIVLYYNNNKQPQLQDPWNEPLAHVFS